MYCPECGSDAADAKYCPECGTQLEGVRSAVKGGAKTTGSARKATSGGGRAAARPAASSGPAKAASTPSRSSGTNPLYLWGGIALIAVIVVVAVLIANHQSSSSNTTADVSGSYSDLVTRANKMFDDGQPYLRSGDMATAASYYSKVAQVYQAAWQKQSTDPAVGADFATSLFYAGDTQGALAIVAQALKLNPTGQVLQNALLNKGNYLAMAGRAAISQGNKAEGEKLLTQAKASYEASIKVAPSSETAKMASNQIKQLSVIKPVPTAGTTP
jgi:hypothetical protein